jgi:C4-dicarboxylate-specific signal transduction histidine kinase
MASGLAHELTQPLTAILSQAQAGKHLKSKGEIEALGSVLDDTITQAKRASAILDRMRQWTKPERKSSSIASVSEAAGVVEALISADAKRLGIEVSFLLAGSAETIVTADSVQVEQVIFNLVRNSMDAVSGIETKSVDVVVRREAKFVVLEVSDSGKGISEELKHRLFEPFVTSKREGTGLGLALCQRLVEQTGGEIALLDEREITTFQARLPLASSSSEASKR